MDKLGQTQLWEDEGFLRVITDLGMIDPGILSWKGRWHEKDECGGGYVTLDEIADILQAIGIFGVYYVWHDTPLNGVIYQYGNYHPKKWVEYGKTKGFA